MDGTEINNGAVAMYMNDYALRSRIRPTAYIVPLDEVSEEVITEIKRILDNQGAEYYEVEAGTKAPVKRYYYIGAFEYLANPKVSSRMTTSFEAGLRAEQEVTFENGALVVPMDQVAGNVIAMTFEPDVNDSNGYDGTLVQGQGYNNATDTVTNEKYLPVIYTIPITTTRFTAMKLTIQERACRRKAGMVTAAQADATPASACLCSWR